MGKPIVSQASTTAAGKLGRDIYNISDKVFIITCLNLFPRL